ncbi:hypothetical protein EDB85DRAFT_2135765 [Lactarius pseudohatsudake]|nr:hypothetical protein EDB85DRAFT_2135765 [Lactarius pseudohatsudake]
MLLMLFLAHTPSLPSHPSPAKTTRTYEYVHSRGGSAPSILCVLSQLHADKCWLVASLGGAQDAQAVTRELEADGMNRRYCKVWGGAGVPATWVLHAGDTNSQSIINHNPLPDIPHKEFVSLMGPLLVLEHYPSPESPMDSSTLSPPPLSPNNGAPFDSLEPPSSTQLIPHADVLLLNRHYAQAQSPAYVSAPRAFLLALTRLAPPHALLVAYWGADGAAALSVPTQEYFQSSEWSAPSPPAASAPSPSSPLSATTNPPRRGATTTQRRGGAERARQERVLGRRGMRSARAAARPRWSESRRADDVGAHDTLIAGMVYALSRRVLPGAPYVPGLAGSTEAQRTEGGQWKLDECWRFATELAGCRARRRAWDGLGEEMARAGWFDA